MARKVTTVLALRDNYTAVIKKARRYTSAFDKDVQKMTARLDKASKKKHDIKVKNSAAMKALTALEKKVAPMRNVMVKVAANIQHFKNQIKPVTDTFKKVAVKAWTITLKVKDGVSFVLTKINTALKKLGKVALVGAGAAVAAGGYALNKGMALEGYDVSMQHFVGVNNPNASKTEVEKQTKDYMAWLRQNANATPFGTEEVIQAGSRAVQVAEGNTKAAQGLVKMAEDMAALTPGKTIMDAMEALADANMGEMERMKEFGFKMTAEEFKRAGGDLFSTKSTSGKTLVEVFGGGAEKFANTTTGMWSTITGEIESDIAEIGLQMAQGLKPLLEWVRDTVLPDLKKWLFEPLKDTGKTGMETLTQGIQDVYYWLVDQIPIAIETIKSVWNGLVAAFDDPNGIIRKALGILGVNVPTVGAGTQTGGTDTTNKQTSSQNLPTVGGHQLNAMDVINGIIAIKGGSTVSKIVTGKGLIANGLGLGAKAGSAAAGGLGGAVSKAVTSAFTALASKAPALGNSIMNGVLKLGSWGGMLMNNPGVMNMMLDAQADLANSGSFGEFAGMQWDKVKKAGSDVGNSFIGTMKADWEFLKWGGSKIWEFWQNTDKAIINGAKGAAAGVSNWWEMGKKGAQLMIQHDPETVKGNMNKLMGALFGGNSQTATPPIQPEIKKPDPAVTSAWESVTGIFQSISSAIQDAINKLATLNSGLSTVHTSNSGAEHGGGSGPGFAAGIKRVPWDNYPALLHKGETVLPSGEAGEYRDKGNQAAKAGNIFNLTFNVNGGNYDEDKLASIFVNKLQEAATNMA